jgi:uncharacterized protein YjbI with pentapeptide repeats
MADKKLTKEALIERIEKANGNLLDLQGFDLSNMSLEGLNMSGADMKYANITIAILTGVNS